MKIYTADNFKTMPWKNGLGMTLELYRLEDENKDLLFRISKASISSNGPFSLFPNVNRALLILEGNGVQLNFDNTSINLSTHSETFYFSGSTHIDCILSDGPCSDFNVFIKEGFGKIIVSQTEFSENTLKNSTSLSTFLFFVEDSILIESPSLDLFDLDDFIGKKVISINLIKTA